MTIYTDGSQVNYQFDHDRMIIERHDQVIHLDTTPCHYGGHRNWFKCPQCSKRVAKLYERESVYLCRYCHKLPYTTQRVAEVDRLLIKVHKLRDRLNCDRNLAIPILAKPKGMHEFTFIRLKLAESIAQMKCLNAMARSLNLNVRPKRIKLTFRNQSWTAPMCPLPSFLTGCSQWRLWSNKQSFLKTFGIGSSRRGRGIQFKS